MASEAGDTERELIQTETQSGGQTPIGEPSSTVYVVDDDASVQKGLSRLLQSAGFRAEVFSSAEEFLNRGSSDGTGCLVLDVQLPGLSGMELQQALTMTAQSLPIIFISGHGDIPMSVQAMKKGAIDFLPKPVDEKDLLNAIAIALRKSKETHERTGRVKQLQRRVATLTPREREVMTLATSGLLNKQIGAELGISEKTVKVHRGRVMAKMNAGSLAELVRLCSEVNAGVAATKIT